MTEEVLSECIDELAIAIIDHLEFLYGYDRTRWPSNIVEALERVMM